MSAFERFYNHYDLHEFGEMMERIDQFREENSSPTHVSRAEQVSATTYRIVVDLPHFSNPIFESAFRNAYRVRYAKTRSPYELIIHLKQPSYFPLEIIRDLQLVFDETMDTMTQKLVIKTPVVPIRIDLQQAS